jgi:hypothetical protein
VERVEGDIRGRVPMVVIIGDVGDVFRISKSPCNGSQLREIMHVKA